MYSFHFSLLHLALWVACHIYTHYPFPLCSNTTRFRKFPNCLIKLIYFAEFLEFLHFFTIFLPPLFPISIVFNFFYIRFPSTVFTFFYFLLSPIIFCIISSASIIPIYFLQSFPIFFSALLHDDLVLSIDVQLIGFLSSKESIFNPLLPQNIYLSISNILSG